MLQRVKSEGHEVCRVGLADHAEDAALLSQLVIVERVGGGHMLGQRGSSESGLALPPR